MEVLRKINLFSSLDDEAFKYLQNIAVKKSFPKNTILFSKGDASDARGHGRWVAGRGQPAPNKFDIPEIQSLGQHLGTHQNIDLALLETPYDTLVAMLAPGSIEVHATDLCPRKKAFSF